MIRIPDEFLSKTDELYNFTINHKKKLINSSKNSSWYKPYIHPSLNNFFNSTDLNNPRISVGFYNDKKDVGAGRMDAINNILTINLDGFQEDKDIFNSLIQHELTHAMDPLVRHNKLFEAYYIKKGSEPDINLNKYYKSQYEYNAFLTPLVIKLKNNNIDAKFIIDFFNSIKNTDDTIENYYHNTSNQIRIYLSFGNKDVNTGYWNFLTEYFNIIKLWSERPTLYKDAMKKIFKNV